MTDEKKLKLWDLNSKQPSLVYGNYKLRFYPSFVAFALDAKKASNVSVISYNWVTKSSFTTNQYTKDYQGYGPMQEHIGIHDGLLHSC